MNYIYIIKMSEEKKRGYMNKSKSDSWTTPKDIYHELNKEFNFDDYDPCPLNDNPNKDGLKEDWATTTFVNPPYSRLKTTKKNGLGWIEKAHQECLKGKTIVLLVPSKTGNAWFHDIVLKYDYEKRFIKGRLKFGNSDDGAPFDSLIVIMRPK